MLNVFENPWLLLTLAGFALLVAAFFRREKPEWGLLPMLAPVLLAGLGFGLDAMVQTDHEAIEHIISSCERAAIRQDVDTMVGFISPKYSDSTHRSKPMLADAARRILKKASIQKIRITSHLITINNDGTAKSELKAAVTLNPDSQYSMGGNLLFVEMAFEYEKINKKWYISRAEVTMVNYQPTNWSAI